MVEDDTLIRDLMVDTLTYCVNRKVTGFENTLAAWRFFENGGHAHMVLSGVDMPDMSGTELLHNLKKKDPAVIFIAMSSVPEHEVLLKNKGADAFLAKPFDINDLFNIVQHYVVGKDQ